MRAPEKPTKIITLWNAFAWRGAKKDFFLFSIAVRDSCVERFYVFKRRM